jgi:predicted DNA-binding protein
MAKRLLDPMNVRLSPQMRERLEELADERSESMAVLIREALDKAYRHKAI